MATGSMTALESFLPKQVEEFDYDTSRYASQSREAGGVSDVSREGLSSLESRTSKIDDLAKALVERCNRSKEFLDSIHRSTFNSNVSDHQPTKEKPVVLSPIADQPSTSTVRQEEAFSTRNPMSNIRAQESYRSAETRPLQKRSELGLREETAEPSTYQSDDYSRLEKEIAELKRAMIDKVQSSDVQRQTIPLKSSLAKTRKYDVISSDEEDEQPAAPMRSKHASTLKENARTIPKPSRSTVKKTKSPTRKSPTSKIVPQTSPSPKKTLATTSSISKQGARRPQNDTAKNVARLKETLEERTSTLQDKYMNLKYKAREMRSVLQEYVTKNLDQEELLKQKDKSIEEYEIELRSAQQDLEKHYGVVQDLSNREEQRVRTEEELISQNKELLQRDAEQKRRFEEIEGFVQMNEEKYLAQLELLQKERQSIRIEVQERDHTINQQNQMVAVLTAEVEALRRDHESNESQRSKLHIDYSSKSNEVRALTTRIDDLDLENKSIKAKMQELVVDKEHLEDKVAKYKKRVDEERARLTGDRQKEVEKKKDKIRRLKDDLKAAEEKAKMLVEERKQAHFESEKQQTQHLVLEKEIERVQENLNSMQWESKSLKEANDNLKNQNEEIFRNDQKEGQKVTEQQAELRKIAKQLKKAEEKIGQRDHEAQKIDEMTNRLKDEVKLLLAENSKGREYIMQLESKLDYLQKRQDDEMMTVDTKISEFDQQIKFLKEENTLLKSNEGESSKEIAMIRDERDRYRKDYKTIKQVNKALERDLKEIDQKVKDFMSEKEYELQEQVKESHLKTQRDSKLKTLNEIQGLIKGHRVSYHGKFDTATK